MSKSNLLKSCLLLIILIFSISSIYANVQSFSNPRFAVGTADINSGSVTITLTLYKPYRNFISGLQNISPGNPPGKGLVLNSHNCTQSLIQQDCRLQLTYTKNNPSPENETISFRLNVDNEHDIYPSPSTPSLSVLIPWKAPSLKIDRNPIDKEDISPEAPPGSPGETIEIEYTLENTSSLPARLEEPTLFKAELTRSDSKNNDPNVVGTVKIVTNNPQNGKSNCLNGAIIQPHHSCNLVIDYTRPTGTPLNYKNQITGNFRMQLLGIGQWPPRTEKPFEFIINVKNKNPPYILTVGGGYVLKGTPKNDFSIRNNLSWDWTAQKISDKGADALNGIARMPPNASNTKGVIAIVGGSNTVATFFVSKDNAETWTPVDLKINPPNNTLVDRLNAITYDKTAKKWIAVGDNGAIIFANAEADIADAKNWHTIKNSNNNNITKADLMAIDSDGKGNFLIAGRNGTVIIGSNNDFRPSNTLKNAGDFLGVHYNGKRFVIVGSKSEVYSSINGATWDLISKSSGAFFTPWAVTSTPLQNIIVGKFRTLLIGKALDSADEGLTNLSLQNPNPNSKDVQSFWGVTCNDDFCIGVGTDFMVRSRLVTNNLQRDDWSGNLYQKTDLIGNLRSVILY